MHARLNLIHTLYVFSQSSETQVDAAPKIQWEFGLIIFELLDLCGNFPRKNVKRWWQWQYYALAVIGSNQTNHNTTLERAILNHKLIPRRYLKWSHQAPAHFFHQPLFGQANWNTIVSQPVTEIAGHSDVDNYCKNIVVQHLKWFRIQFCFAFYSR